ncbi:unnamed protein product [Ixodes hexagonus]
MLSPTGKGHLDPPPTQVGKRPSLAVLVACATLGMASILVFLLLVLGIPVKGKSSLTENSTYCCPDVARQLIKAANFSLNACDDYFMYTCYNWRALGDESTERFSFPAVFLSVTTGRSRSAAGKAISRFHHSCVLTLGQEVDLPAKAMTALLDSTEASKDMSPTGILRVLLQLSLLHRLYTPVNLQLIPGRQGAVSKLLLRSQRRPSSDAWKFWQGQEGLLRAFNARLGISVDKRELLRLENRTASKAPKTEHHAPNMDLLKNLVPNVSKYQWIEMMKPFYFGPLPTVLVHTDIEVIRQELFALTVDGSERREARLAFLLVGASVDLLDDFFYPRLSTRWPSLFRYCGGHTKGLLSLWRILMKEEFTDPRKDAIVGSLFTTIKEAVTGDALQLLDPVDSGKARDLLSAVRLVRPRDLVPRNIALPVTGKTLYLDTLAIQKFDVTMGKSFEAQDGDVYNPGLYGYAKRLPFYQANTLVVPALSYLFLRFPNDTDPAINMAIIGVKLSLIFWKIVFDSKDWSLASKSRIEEIISCSGLWGAVNRRSWNLHRLSLRSAVRAASASGLNWHRLLDAWVLVRLSRAQMFYMKYVTRFCDRNNTYSSERVHYALHSIRDFREAYGCASPANISSQCSFDI